MNSTSSIITIGREYGSGGRQIGQEVAKYFGIKCYDKELLEHAANDSGICKELFEHHDEKPTNSFLYSLVMDTYSFGYSSSGFSDMPMRIASKHGKTPKEAKDMITKTDKSRASYYNYYTNKKWGAARSYNLCIDSGKLGIDYATEAIIESIKIFDRTKISK